jgi:trigger factor
MRKYKILGTKNLPDSEVEIEVEIEEEHVHAHRSKAMAKIQTEVNLPGFRPGHVPEAMIVKQVGDLFIYNEMADLAINDAFPEIVTEAKANFITCLIFKLPRLLIKARLCLKSLALLCQK